MPTSYVICVATAGDKAIAGPLVAAALVLDARIANPRFVWSPDKRRRPQALSDFDGLPKLRKQQIVGWLRSRAEGFGIVTASVRQLNQGDPRELRRLIMGRAIYRAVEHAIFRQGCFHLDPKYTKIMVSGMDRISSEYVRDVTQSTHPERHGRPWHLDAAYSVARVHRDALMHDVSREHPDYEFALNNGYASGAHREAMEQRGLTPYHRLASPLVREVKDVK